MSLLTRAPRDRAAAREETSPESAAAPAEGRKAGRAPKGKRVKPVTEPAAVNLLSPWVLEGLRVRRLRGRFVLAAVLLVVVVAGGWGWLRLDLGRTQAALEDDQSLNSEISRQIAELGDVRVFGANVGVRAQKIETTMARDTEQSTVLDALDAALPDGASWAGIEVLLPTDAALVDPAAPPAADGVACPGPDPFGARPVVGCVKISGVAPSRDAVSTLVQALGADSLFVEPFVTTTVIEDTTVDGLEAVTFEGSVGLSDGVYTGRYLDVAEPTSANGEGPR